MPTRAGLAATCAFCPLVLAITLVGAPVNDAGTLSFEFSVAPELAGKPVAVDSMHQVVRTGRTSSRRGWFVPPDRDEANQQTEELCDSAERVNGRIASTALNVLDDPTWTMQSTATCAHDRKPDNISHRSETVLQR